MDPNWETRWGSAVGVPGDPTTGPVFEELTGHDDPDLPEVVREITRHRDAYLRWGRDVLGWAIYVFRHPDQMA